MTTEAPPQPSREGAWFPHVISQVPDGAGSVLVTWAMPGLTVATVRVPQTAWLEGLHHFLPPAIERVMFPVPPHLDAHPQGHDD